MRESGISKSFTVLLVLMFLVGLGFEDNASLKVSAAGRKQDQNYSNKKEVNRIRKYFGKKDSTGQDYSLESTTGAGVGAVAKQGLNEDDVNTADEAKTQMVKDSLYKNSPDATLKTIENVIKPSK